MNTFIPKSAEWMNYIDTFLIINTNCLRSISISTTQTTKVDSDVVLSSEEYRAIVDEDWSVNDKYSKFGDFYPEKHLDLNGLQVVEGKEWEEILLLEQRIFLSFSPLILSPLPSPAI